MLSFYTGIYIGAHEICPKCSDITAERVDEWHRLGLGVGAWGISDTEIMKRVYDAGIDGMTVNFPDKLTEYIASKYFIYAECGGWINEKEQNQARNNFRS